MVADEIIDKYYNTTAYLSHSSNKTLISFFFDFFSNIMVKKKTSFMLGLGGVSAYLDYGCGIGKLISSMNKKGVAPMVMIQARWLFRFVQQTLNASSNLMIFLTSMIFLFGIIRALF